MKNYFKFPIDVWFSLLRKKNLGHIDLSVYVSLCCLGMDNEKERGFVSLLKGVGYDLKSLVKILDVDPDKLEASLAALALEKAIKIHKDGELYRIELCHYRKMRTEYQRQQKYQKIYKSKQSEPEPEPEADNPSELPEDITDPDFEVDEPEQEDVVAPVQKVPTPSDVFTIPNTGGSPVRPEKNQPERVKDILKRYTSFGEPSPSTKSKLASTPEAATKKLTEAGIIGDAPKDSEIIKKARAKGMSFFDRKFYHACCRQYGIYPEEMIRCIERVKFPKDALKNIDYANKYFRKGLIDKGHKDWGWLRDVNQ